MTTLEVATMRTYLYRRVAFYLVVAPDDCGESGLHLVGQHVSEETQASHVYAHDGRILAADAHRSLQECAVATDRHGVIGIKIITVEHLNAGEVEMLVVHKEVAERAVEYHALITRTKIVERTS